MAKLFDKNQMLFLFLFYSSHWFVLVNSLQIPFIDNVIFKGRNASSITPPMNMTRTDCLCLGLSLPYSVVNYFPNNTCQLFPNFPLTYRFVDTLAARVYFPRRIFPNASQSYTSDITEVLTKLKGTNQTSVNVLAPRDAVIDNNGYLVTVEESAGHLDRYNATNLKIFNHTSLPNTIGSAYAIAYFNGTYYVSTDSNVILAVDSENLTVVATLSAYPSGIRGIIFLNNGQTMVLADFYGNSLVFLNRMNITAINYEFAFSQQTSFRGPHGIRCVNDSFFYVTSYRDNSLYSFTATTNSTIWDETRVLSVIGISSVGFVRVTIDEFSQFWCAFETSYVLIYSQQGNLVGNWTIPNSAIFDIKIMNNYLMYLTDSNGQILRIEPNIDCDL